ncbi:ATPase involved in chromosome partitioning [Methylophilaceae bacterium 11]|nr:ATPase involved in chromosome partitioning [Methylophilaceae bacterium 11]
MKHILVANAKGGSGKTTLATNLAGYLASQQQQVILADLDRQQSATQWLKRRPKDAPKIFAANTDHTVQWKVTDSPAGLRDEKLADAVKEADLVIVPIQPSAFDIGAAGDFLEVLIAEKTIRKHKTFVGLVGSRVNSRTHAALGLAEFMTETGLPVLAYLRNSQVYTTAAEQGLSIFDMRPSLVAQDIEQWSVLLDWINENSQS